MAATLSPNVAELAQLRDQRDRKLTPVVLNHKPAWLIDVSVNLPQSQIVFDVVFRPYTGRGWFKRRHRYDGQVDVLHFLGEVPFPESELSRLPHDALIK